MVPAITYHCNDVPVRGYQHLQYTLTRHKIIKGIFAAFSVKIIYIVRLLY